MRSHIFSNIAIAPLLVLLCTTTLLTMVNAIPSVLVFSRTTGYRHDSIPTAIGILQQQAASLNVNFTFTEDNTLFTVDNLSKYDGILFLMMTGTDVLDNDQQAALKTYFQSGGVYIGVHSATSALDNDTNYLQAAGAFFDYHPPLQTATFAPVTKDHPATANFPDTWTYQEEVYYFKSDPRDLGAVVLLTVVDGSYVNNGTSTGNFNEGDPHPIAWYIESPQSAQPLLSGAPKAGRSFYTSLGHLNSTWESQTFQTHLFGGLSWALDGNSTRAYGVGLVGASANNATISTSSSSASSSTASNSASSAVAGSSTSSTGSASATGTSSAAPAASSSKSAADAPLRLRGGGGGGGWAGVIGGLALGIAAFFGVGQW